MKNFPKKLDSKTSYLRIEVPENLDLALEGLIRKVLRDQPKTDDIYSFAAEYFENLLKIRDQANIKCTSRMYSSINNEEALQMIKLANTFKKPGSGKLPKKLNGSSKTTNKTSNKELALKSTPSKSKNCIRQTQKNLKAVEEKQNTDLVRKPKDENLIAEENENIQRNDKFPQIPEDSKEKNIKEAQLKAEELQRDDNEKIKENQEKQENLNTNLLKFVKEDEDKKGTENLETVENKEKIQTHIEPEACTSNKEENTLNKNHLEKTEQNVLNAENQSDNINIEEKTSTTDNQTLHENNENGKEPTGSKVEEENISNQFDNKNTAGEKQNVLNVDNQSNNVNNQEKPSTDNKVINVEKEEGDEVTRNVEPQIHKNEENLLLEIKNKNNNGMILSTDSKNHEQNEEETVEINSIKEIKGNLLNEESIQNENVETQEKETLKFSTENQEGITNIEEKVSRNQINGENTILIDSKEEGEERLRAENQMDSTNNEKKDDENEGEKNGKEKEGEKSGTKIQEDLAKNEEKLDENEMGKARMVENITKEEDTSDRENQMDITNNEEKLDENETGKGITEQIVTEEKKEDTSGIENQMDVTNNDEKLDENETGKEIKKRVVTEEKKEDTSGTENQMDITNNEEKEENNLENKVDEKMLVGEKENNEICEEENKEEKKLVEEENEKNKQDLNIVADNLKPQLSVLPTERSLSKSEQDNNSEVEVGKVNTTDCNQNSEISNLEVNEVQQNLTLIKDDDVTLEEATEKEESVKVLSIGSSNKSIELEEKENKNGQISDEKDKEIPEDKKSDMGLTNENMSTATSAAEDNEKDGKEKDKVKNLVEKSCVNGKAENDVNNDVGIEIDENKKSFFKTLTHSLKEPDDDKFEPQENLKNEEESEIVAAEENANAQKQGDLVVETEEAVKNSDTIEKHENWDKKDSSGEKFNAKVTETFCNSPNEAEANDNKSIEEELCVVVDALSFNKPDANEAEAFKGEENNDETQQAAERKIKTIETHYYDLLTVPEMVTKEYVIHHTKDDELPKAPESEITEPHEAMAEVRTTENESQMKMDSEQELMSLLHFSGDLAQIDALKANEIFLLKEKYFSSMQVNLKGAKVKKKSEEDDKGKVEEVMVKKSVTGAKAVPLEPRDSEELKEQSTETSMNSKEEKYKKGLSDDPDSNASISADSKSVDIDVPFISDDVNTVIETQPPEENNEERIEETPLQLPTLDIGLANEIEVSTTKGKLPTKKLTRTCSQTLVESDISRPKKKLLTKTKSTSSIRERITDTDIWSTIEKELEDAATKIQSKFRAYSTRKKLRREDAVQITTEESSPSEESKDGGETLSTGEFHDSIVLSVHPR